MFTDPLLPAMSRRDFIQTAAVFVSSLAIGACSTCRFSASEKDHVTIGMFTDVHYADKEKMGNRYYRESIAKAEQCIGDFNSARPDFAIHLGDFVDSGKNVEEELEHLEQIEREYAKFNGERHYVLGNHELARLSKEQFLANSGARENYYSFDKGRFHFVILDACYNEDESDYKAGNFDWRITYVPAAEREWLKADLKATKKTTVVFVHQRMDDDGGAHGIKNAPKVREILEESGKVPAVFQGHDHRGAHSEINGIHYHTFPSVVDGSGLENNAYALVRIWTNGSISIDGFGKQEDRELTVGAG